MAKIDDTLHLSPIGRCLAGIRQTQGVSFTETARRLLVTHDALTEIEMGKRPPPADFEHRICGAFSTGPKSEVAIQVAVDRSRHRFELRPPTPDARQAIAALRRHGSVLTDEDWWDVLMIVDKALLDQRLEGAYDRETITLSALQAEAQKRQIIRERVRDEERLKIPPERMAKGDLSKRLTERAGELAYVSENAHCLDRLFADGRIDEEQHKAGMDYHGLYLAAGRDRSPTSKYGRVTGEGASDRMAHAARECRDIERWVKWKTNGNCLMVFMRVAGDNRAEIIKGSRNIPALKDALNAAYSFDPGELAEYLDRVSVEDA